MPDTLPKNAWVVEFRDPINSEWMKAAHYPAIDIVEIDGADLTVSDQEFDLGEVRASHHAKMILLQSGDRFEVRTRFEHFPPFAKRVGDTITLKGRYDG
jgi:hypothetical protein